MEMEKKKPKKVDKTSYYNQFELFIELVIVSSMLNMFENRFYKNVHALHRFAVGLGNVCIYR